MEDTLDSFIDEMIFDMEINSSFKRIALLATERAARILKEHFRKKLKIFRKKMKKVEWVTDVDLAAEEIIRKTIKDNFPSHDILGEERGGKIGKGFTWIIDPLDGTSNHIIGLPFFALALALLNEEKPILAIVFNPVSRELYLAEKGKGAFLNQKKMRVNDVNSLFQVLLGFNKGKDLVGGLKILTKIAPYVRTFRCHGSGHLEICQVAAGTSEGFVTAKPTYWDMGAGAFIAEEAGGKVTDFKGRNYTHNSPNLIVTNGKIHSQLLKLIK